MPTWAIILIIVLVILIIWGIKVQKKLISADEFCGNAMSQIGVQQNSRWDALGALADLTKQYDEHEYNTLSDVIGKRRQIGRNSSAKDVEAQENMLTDAMTHIMAVAENYPELKANEMYGKTMDSVKEYEENVRLARMTYNDTVTIFNRLVRQFPTSLIANMIHMSIRDYLETAEAVTAMPNMNR